MLQVSCGLAPAASSPQTRTKHSLGRVCLVVIASIRTCPLANCWLSSFEGTSGSSTDTSTISPAARNPLTQHLSPSLSLDSHPSTGRFWPSSLQRRSLDVTSSLGSNPRHRQRQTHHPQRTAIQDRWNRRWRCRKTDRKMADMLWEQ